MGWLSGTGHTRRLAVETDRLLAFGAASRTADGTCLRASPWRVRLTRAAPGDAASSVARPLLPADSGGATDAASESEKGS